MHTSFSQHTESSRASVTDVWPRHAPATFRPWLNVQALHELLQIATSNESDEDMVGNGKGKKRASTPLSRRILRSAKRARTSEGSTPAGSGSVTPSSTVTTEGEYLYDWPRLEYPELSTSEDVQSVPVLRHTYQVQYTGIGEDVSGSSIEESNLLEIISDLQTTPDDEQPHTIDLGPVDFALYQDRLVVVSPLLKHRVPWTLLLPPYGDPIDLAWHDMSSPLVQDVMMAAYILQSAGRASSSAQLVLVVLPSGAVLESELPFRLHVQTTVSLLAPAIFAPFPRPKPRTKARTLEIEDAQRRFLSFLFPPSPPSPFSPSHTLTPETEPETLNGTTGTNIPFFYSILLPAPPLPSAAMQELMQPPDLLPTLLPFQRRSVAWLLDREGKSVTPNGEVVPKPPSHAFSFWDPIKVPVLGAGKQAGKQEEGEDEEEMTWYLNRLTGLLSPTPPSPSLPHQQALGGILAEEPGLGKTLESIALILMNPPPPEWNPVDMRRWDEVGGLEVAGVKTTLIVTPPALASQWADELAIHAPSLRVLVYDGWSKVPVPITQAQVEAAKLERRHERLREKLRGRGKGKVKGKAVRRKRKGKRKYDWDSDWESEDEFDSMDLDYPGSSFVGEDEEADLEDEEEELQTWPSYVHTYDIVITTYSVLRADFNVALAAPVRPRRADVVYADRRGARMRSPLVMVEWARVVMDEVQMVGGGKTE